MATGRVGWADSLRRHQLPPDWEKRRLQVLVDANWLCEIYMDGCIRVATDVDHKRRGNDHSLGNLQAACSWCHDRKSAAEGVARRRELKARRKRPAERHPGRL